MTNFDGIDSVKICLILEGYEEKAYFDRLFELSIFNKKYNIIPINAKGAKNIPAYYYAKYSSNSYHLVLVVCDADKNPEVYYDVIKGINNILGGNKAQHVVYFNRPCILQIILSHFGDVELTTQAKKMNQDEVFNLTGVDGYDAREDQLIAICSKIKRANCDDMEKRMRIIGDDFNNIPSSNFMKLYNDLKSDDTRWVSESLKKIES